MILQIIGLLFILALISILIVHKIQDKAKQIIGVITAVISFIILFIGINVLPIEIRGIIIAMGAYLLFISLYFIIRKNSSITNNLGLLIIGVSALFTIFFYHIPIHNNDGKIFVWGDNYYGQLGNNTLLNSNIPIPIDSNIGFTDISIGTSHCMAIDTNGSVWAWGDNSYGKLGNGTWNNSTIPVKVKNISDITKISAGEWHSLALEHNGIIWAWGNNYFGQIDGDALIDYHSIPVKVKAIANIINIKCADFTYNYAIHENGSVWKWGDNVSFIPRYPVQLIYIPNLIDILGNRDFQLALDKDGVVWAWGNNTYGQIGDGTTDNTNIPKKVSSLKDIKKISIRNHACFAVDSNGILWAWGDNGNGEFGNGNYISSNLPIPITNSFKIESIESSVYHTLILDTNGHAWAWGNNKDGELGNGTNIDSIIPVKIDSIHSITKISASLYNSMALQEGTTSIIFIVFVVIYICLIIIGMFLAFV
ncbi:MAG: chromosome condensation regulator [Anaerocolumna sp.]|nr:chromosome condensation regulator [Anaerocolumna sp.]